MQHGTLLARGVNLSPKLKLLEKCTESGGIISKLLALPICISLMVETFW